MKNMFRECNNLKDLQISSFDTQKVKEIYGIFYKCQKKIIESNLYLFKNFDYEDLF